MKTQTGFPPLSPIGVVRSPFGETAGTPIQPVFAADACGRVELLSEYAEGLRDLDGFERIWLIYLFDRSPGGRLHVVPFRDRAERGIFATRAPCRPNPIGLSCLRLLKVEGTVISIADVDVLDGTPLLDIKPYVPAFNAFPGSRSGWYERTTVNRILADGRFASGGGQPKGGER